MAIVWVNYIDQWWCGCVRPRGSYGPKSWIPCDFFMTEGSAFMIIFVDYVYKQGCGCVRLGMWYRPKRGNYLKVYPWFWLMHWLSFGWRLERNEDVFVSSQLEATDPKGGIPCIKIFMTMFDSFMIIWVKYGELQVHTLDVVRMK